MITNIIDYKHNTISYFFFKLRGILLKFFLLCNNLVKFR
jgi:hypothetical protein